MARPAKSRKICRAPKYTSFGPEGLHGLLNPEVVELCLDEYEVLRMVDLEGKTHEQCAKHMEISRTTVTEIYERARKKVADMIVNGKHMEIVGGNYSVCNGANPRCHQKENTTCDGC